MKRMIPLISIALLLAAVFYFRLDKYLSFAALHQHHAALQAWTQDNYILASLAYAGVYTLAVAISIPGAVFLTLAGGFLFGPLWGALLVITSATVGATLLFFAVRLVLADWIEERAARWVAKMRQGFQANAFSYLLVLRLVPLFPFWVVNIVPALLGVSARVFMVATFIGIIPGTVVYIWVGSGLSHVFASNQSPDLGIIFDPKVLLPLLALAMLSLIPIIYNYFTQKQQGRKA